MRQLVYSVAMSLDGFIAGPKGEYDWITKDPTVDFTALYKKFDTLLMGRRTYEMACKGPGATIPGMKTIVCSKTLTAIADPKITLSNDAKAAVMVLKSHPGKDIWLFGGASLFRSLLDAGLVDRIDVSVVPILLSDGIQLLPAGLRSPRLHLLESNASSCGIVRLSYTVQNGVT